MKNNLSKVFLLMFSLCLMSTQCDEDMSSVNTDEVLNIAATVESGTWKITNYQDSGQNETVDFSDYIFTFESSRDLEAVNATETKTGIWSVSDNSSSSEEDIDFTISFPISDSDNLEDLNDDWDLVSYSNTEIVLRDVNGDGSIDELIFTKN